MVSDWSLGVSWWCPSCLLVVPVNFLLGSSGGFRVSGWSSDGPGRRSRSGRRGGPGGRGGRAGRLGTLSPWGSALV